MLWCALIYLSYGQSCPAVAILMLWLAPWSYFYWWKLLCSVGIDLTALLSVSVTQLETRTVNVLLLGNRCCGLCWNLKLIGHLSSFSRFCHILHCLFQGWVYFSFLRLFYCLKNFKFILVVCLFRFFTSSLYIFEFWRMFIAYHFVRCSGGPPETSPFFSVQCLVHASFLAFIFLDEVKT